MLINNASIAGICPMPFHSPYIASKFAIRGFSHALRQELADEPNIHVCTVYPSSIDTPLWQRSANYTGRKSKPLDPVHPVEQVAGIVVGLAQAPEREVFAGASGWALSEQHAAAPELTEDLVAALVARDLVQEAPSEPNHGSIFAPEPSDGSATGGWLALDRPGVPAGDLPVLFAAPGLLAFGPALFSWKLLWNFPQQVTRQMWAFAAMSARPAAVARSER